MTITQRIIGELKTKLEAARLNELPRTEVTAAMLEILNAFPAISELNFDRLSYDLLDPDFEYEFDPARPNRFILLRTPVFFIEVLLWGDVSTAIHNHSFNAAVRVIDGSAYNIGFAFELEGELSSMTWGNLTLGVPHEVPVGQSFSISSSHDFIHRVVHLNSKCASLRVGLIGEQGIRQYSYHYPGLGVLFRNKVERLRPARFSVLGHLIDKDIAAYQANIDGLLRSEMGPEMVQFLAQLQAVHPIYDFYERHIANFEDYPLSLRQKIYDVFAFQRLERTYEGVEQSKASARLLLSVLNFVGFKSGSAAYFKKWKGDKAATWLQSTLFEIALSRSSAAPVARHLLEVWSAHVRGLPQNFAARLADIPQGDDFEVVWKLSSFSTFLAELGVVPLTTPATPFSAAYVH